MEGNDPHTQQEKKILSFNTVACILVTRQVIMGSGFGKVIYLDFQLEELQLFVTQSYTT
jgi:hypothetical protein